MAKRSFNNSAGRRAHGEKPYDANNSFVKKMASKVTEMIPQRSWISKWFNSPTSNGELSAAEGAENPEEQEAEETLNQPPAKRPRIRMDVTHPPGTFTIQPRARNKDQYGEDSVFFDAVEAGPSTGRSFVSSTPAIGLGKIRSTIPSDLRQPHNNGTANGVDENSESGESTSGCSSLIPQNSRQEGLNSQFHRKGLAEDKLSYTNHLQSPRSLFIDSISGTRESLSSRRPSFNLSMMNNEGHPLERGGNVLSSPFYSGNITFGGANALGTSAMRQNRRNLAGTSEFQLRVPRRASVQVKPSNAPGVDASGMSQTAKRILEALEHFSSPIADAKKIPVRAVSYDSTLAKKRGREEAFDLAPASRVGLRHLTRELAVPTVPDMLKLKRRQRLQDTTLAARRIITAKSEPLPSQTNTEAREPAEYHLRNNDSQKFFGKVRAKGKKKPNIEEPPEAVNLPSITLPITSLPSFDIPLPKANSTPSIASSLETKSASNPCKTFKFSSPIKVPSEITSPLQSINHFTFSKPLTADSNEKSKPESPKPISNSLNFNFGSSQAVPSANFVWNASSTAPRPKVVKQQTEKKKKKKEEDEPLKTGSVMDVLGSNFKMPQANLWDCSECLIKNNDDDETCVACKKPRKKDTKATTNLPATENNFGAQFKMSTDKWECQCCLVRNPESETKCVSCMTPKQDKKPEVLPQKPIESSKSDLMEKFKPAKDSWECSGCMLRNPSSVISCPCCNTSKPGLLKAPAPKKDDEIIKPLPTTNTSDKWECPSCMVRNDLSASACVCCTTPNPSAAPKAPVVSTPSSLPTIISNFGDKFKAPVGSWSCDTCMINNKADVTECVACGTLKPGATKSKTDDSTKNDSTPKFSFGVPASSSGAATFSFGIPSSAKTDEKPKAETTNGFTFGAPVSSQPSTGFTFGIPKTTQSVEPAKPSGFTFAVPKTIVSEEKQPEVQTLFKDASNTKVGFSFSNPTETKIQPPKVDAAPENKEPVKSISFAAPAPALPTISSVDGNAQSTAAPTSSISTPSIFSISKPTPASTQSAPLLSFGNSSTTLAKPAEVSKPPEAEPPAKKPILSFGQPSESTSPTFEIQKSETKPVLSFGTPAMGSSTDKPAFTLDNKLPSFSTIENKTSLFGKTTEKPMFSVPTPTFGAPATTVASTTSTTPSLFGAASTSSIITPSPSFGTPSSSASTPAMFSAPKPAEPTANPGLFTFGASNSQTSTQPATGGFNFSAPNNNTAAKPMFSFGSTNQTTPQPATGFGFSSSTPAVNPTPTPTPAFNFNAPKPEAPSAFSGTPAATPNIFGTSQPSSASSFGTLSSGTSGGFNFGGAPASTASSTGSTPTGSAGFNFQAAAPATGGFNFNVPSTFNFTAGNAPQVFNATPQAATPQPNRKIRKAARRLPRTGQ